MIQPGIGIQLSSGSNVARSRWKNVRGAWVGAHAFFPRGMSGRRAIRRTKSVWFAVVFSLLFSNKIKNIRAVAEQKEFISTLTHIRTTASNRKTLRPFPPRLSLAHWGDGEGEILNNLTFWSDCNRPTISFHCTNYKDELFQFEIVPEKTLKIKRPWLQS